LRVRCGRNSELEDLVTCKLALEDVGQSERILSRVELAVSDCYLDLAPSLLVELESRRHCDDNATVGEQVVLGTHFERVLYRRGEGEEVRRRERNLLKAARLHLRGVDWHAFRVADDNAVYVHGLLAVASNVDRISACDVIR